jgi:hypothetical protein
MKVAEIQVVGWADADFYPPPQKKTAEEIQIFGD